MAKMSKHEVMKLAIMCLKATDNPWLLVGFLKILEKKRGLHLEQEISKDIIKQFSMFNNITLPIIMILY